MTTFDCLLGFGSGGDGGAPLCYRYTFSLKP